MPGTKLEFPQNHADRYKARIRFETLIVDPISVGSIMNAHASNSTDPANYGAVAPEGFTKFLDLGGSFSNKIQFNDTELLRNQVKRRSGETCHLYMPPSIQIQDGVS